MNENERNNKLIKIAWEMIERNTVITNYTYSGYLDMNRAIQMMVDLISTDQCVETMTIMRQRLSNSNMPLWMYSPDLLIKELQW